MFVRYIDIAINIDIRYKKVTTFKTIGGAHQKTSERAAPPVSEEEAREGNWE
jgi:hypothetical protein